MGKKLEKKGAPAYMVTLGDMWSLMLTFFIMLFAMSQVDATKFQKIDGSLKDTFGFRQQTLRYGPPPGVNPVQATSASDHFPDDIIFDHPIQNTINDPEFAARKIVSCEKQVTKQKNNRMATLLNGDLIEKTLQSEIDTKLFYFIIEGTTASLLISSKNAFENKQTLNARTQKALKKLAIALTKRKGDLTIRSYLPQENEFTYAKMIQHIALQSSVLAEALTSSVSSLENNIFFEIIPFDQQIRKVASSQIENDEILFEIAITKK